ncbi:MAG: MarR family transcriptional regulator [Euryarchaeota archaeon]|nr:MarR family transcriptional regulator [Euryarchaeota archaeon]
MEFRSLLVSKCISVNDIIKCLLCIGDTEIQILEILKKREATVEEIAEKLKINRSTAQRCLQTLVATGLIFRKSTTEIKGRKFIYRAISERELKEILKNTAEQWYQKVMESLK